MRKLNLARLALLGIATSLLHTGTADSSTNQYNQALAQADDQYICSNYNNCGKCGGRCNIKNPNTPGLTPEQKKQAEEYQKNHPSEEGKEQKNQPSAPGQEDCGVFCASSDSDASQSTKVSTHMRAKRQNIAN